jgi:hypothetical protein
MAGALTDRDFSCGSKAVTGQAEKRW